MIAAVEETTAPREVHGKGGILSTAWEWDRLVREFFPRLVAAGHRRFSLSREDCEDALQIVAQEIVTRRPRALVPEAFLTTAFYRRCFKIVQARKPSYGPPGENQLVDDPRQRLLSEFRVSSALAHIHPRCRAILRLYAIEGCTLPETASRIRQSPKAMWKSVQRCLGRLKQWLE